MLSSLRSQAKITRRLPRPTLGHGPGRQRAALLDLGRGTGLVATLQLPVNPAKKTSLEDTKQVVLF